MSIHAIDFEREAACPTIYDKIDYFDAALVVPVAVLYRIWQGSLKAKLSDLMFCEHCVAPFQQDKVFKF